MASIKRTMIDRKTGQKTTTTTNLKPVTSSEFNGSGRMKKTISPITTSRTSTAKAKAKSHTEAVAMRASARRASAMRAAVSQRRQSTKKKTY